MAKLVAAQPAILHIPKLTGNNYKLWSERIVAALEREEVWDYAQGLIKEPSEESQKAIWRQKNALAVLIIKSSLSDIQLGHVMGVRNAERVWTKLKTIHGFNDDARLPILLREFIQFKLGSSIDEGAAILTRLQNEIGAIDSESRLSDAIKIAVLLNSLGPEYRTTIAEIEVNGTATFEEIVAKLKNNEKGRVLPKAS